MGRKERRLRKQQRGAQAGAKPKGPFKQGQGQQGSAPVTGDMVSRMSQMTGLRMDRMDREERDNNWQRGVYGDRSQGNGQNGQNGQLRLHDHGHHNSHQQRDQIGYQQNYSGYQPRAQEDETVFRCGSDDITAKCPIAQVPDVYIPEPMWHQFIQMAKGFKVEWLAYLQGKLEKVPGENGANAQDQFTVSKVYFPPQTATGAHVDVDEGFQAYPGTIAAIHSHVDMGVFWSGEDSGHSNWPVEIVINSKGDYKCLVRHKLDCGKWAKADATVYLTGLVQSQYQKALDDAFTKGERLKRAREQQGRRSGYVDHGDQRTEDHKPDPEPVVIQPHGTTQSFVGGEETRPDIQITHNDKLLEVKPEPGQSLEDAVLEAMVDAQMDEQGTVGSMIDEELVCPLCEGHGWLQHPTPHECQLCDGQGDFDSVEELEESKREQGWSGTKEQTPQNQGQQDQQRVKDINAVN